MHQTLFLKFRINQYLFQISILVQISVADTISMSEDWNRLGALLNRLHQLVASAGDDQVDVAVQLEKCSIKMKKLLSAIHLQEVSNLISSRHKAYGVAAAMSSQSLAHLHQVL